MHNNHGSIIEPQLDTLYDELISQFKLGSSQSKHPFHIMQLGTVELTNSGVEPQIRSVVFKEFIEETLTFVFHTDSRSPKMCQLQENQSVILHFYDSVLRQQVRIKGKSQILNRESKIYIDHQQNLSLSGLRCYLGPFAPTTKLSEYHCNIQDDWRFRAPSEEERQETIANFEVICVQAEQIDYLRLRAQGHIRCHFQIVEGKLVQSSWLAP